MKRMLFNATQSEELRVAIVDGQKLIDLDIETVGKEQRKSNIYKGVITRIEPSLEAAFVNYGTDRHGFLPFKEVARSYFQGESESGRNRIQDVLREGQELIVQVDKDERGNKGAALTTFISLAGRYLVLMPNNPRGGGVSRRIEGEDRNELRDVMAQMQVPNGMSIIARTAGIGRSLEELQWDLNYLLQLWTAIENASTIQSGPFLIYQEGSLVIRAIRDYFQPDIGEILIDTPEIYDQALQFMNHVMPGNVSRVKLYRDEIPLFSRFQIEHQIETAFSREVRLPSGGAIVIDHTEALVSVDVNSGRSTRGVDIEQTAFNTNLEAADEVARQMRLRDLGGLVVIDFIDMENQRNQREVENRLRDALHYDRARVQTGKISRFGLLELSRQRLRSSLGESNHMPCPRCHGTGHIRGIESTALHILRITQEEAMKENSAIIQVQLPVEAATFLLNEKRAEIHKIEQRMGVQVVLIPNIHMETPNYTITRIRHDDVAEEHTRSSYQMVEMPSSDIEEAIAAAVDPKIARVEAAVKGITPASPAPMERQPLQDISLVSRIKGWFSRIAESKPAAAPQTGGRNDDSRPRRGNKPNRNARGNDRKNGQEQRPQQQRPEQRPDRQERPDRQDRQNQQRPQRQNQPRAENIDAEKPVQQGPQSNGNETGEGRSRRGRGRRDRGNRGERQPNQQTHADREENQSAESAPVVVVEEKVQQPVPQVPATTPAAVEAAVETPVSPVEKTRARKDDSATPERAVETTKPAARETRSRQPAAPKESTEASAPASIEAQQPAEVKAEPKKSEDKELQANEPQDKEQKAEKKPRQPRRRKPEAEKPVDLAAVGLQLVETKADTKAAPTPEPEQATSKSRKEAAWQKKAAEPAKDEPLVIVQTQK